MKFREVMPDINKHLDDSMHPIVSDTSSHEGLIVPEIILKYGSILAKLKDLPTVFSYGFRCISEVKKSYRTLKHQPANNKKEISKTDLEDLKHLAQSLGVDDIGFTEVKSSYIFAGKCVLYKNAILLTMEMQHDKIALAPSGKTSKEIFRTYYGLGYAVNEITAFLKKHGYKAHAGPALGGETNYPLMAEKAGLGAIGKHGILITPKFGPSLRLAAVYTEIENFPTTNENPYLWVKDFCNKCNKCVKKCPTEAIYKNTVIFEDGSEQHIDYKKCAVPFSNDHGCTICIKECVFFTTSYEKIKSKYFLKE